jgi:hypothetical protein
VATGENPVLGPVVEGPDISAEYVSPYAATLNFIYGWTGATGRRIPGSGTYLPSPSVLDETTPLETGREYSVDVAQPGDPIPYVFGNVRVKPKIIALTEYSGYLYVDYLISQGPISSIDKVFIGGEEQTPSPTTWQYFTGAAGQATSSLMKTAIGNSPLSYDALSGLAHVVAKLTPSQSFDVTFEVSGMLLADPRLSPVLTEAYSVNPALVLRRIFTDCGYTVNDTDVATCANYCDEQVNAKNRWTLNLQADTRRPLRDWVQTIATYGNILLDLHGGTVRMVPDQAVTSSPAIARVVTAANIVAGSAKTTKVGTRNVPNKVIVTYQELDGKQRTATAGSGSTGEITRLSMPGIQDYSEARRFAQEVLNKAQADLRHSHVTHDAGLVDGIGDLMSITYAPHGLSAKVMRLVGYTEVERGRWRREFVEYDSGLYDSTSYTRPTVGDTALQSPNTPPAGPTPTAVEELYTDETGTTYSRLKITFTGSTWPYVRNYRVTCDGQQNVLNALIPHTGTDTHTVYTAALKQGITYLTCVYIQSSSGALSETCGTASTVALGKLLPPGDVPSAGFTAYEAGNLVALSWQAAEEITGDLRGYTIKRLPAASYVGTSADWANTNAVTIVDRHDGTTFLTPSQVAGSYYFGVKAVDNAGNYSTNATWKAVTITDNDGSTNVIEVNSGVLINMHEYIVDGDARYVITSTGQTWGTRFGNTSPLATWGDAGSPAERWGGDLATDSSFTSEVWDIGSIKQGSWFWNDQDVTLFGGTQANTLILGDESSPISYTTHSGNSVNASGRYVKISTSTTDSPATAGDGLHIRLPIQVSFSGAILNQSGSETIAAASPLANPVTVTFAIPYSTAPTLNLTVTGSTPKVAAADNLSSTGFDLYLWLTDGTKTSGTVNWSATGT